MALLKYALFVLAVGCYDPAAPDCTLACTANSDCISGQACTTDHMCADTSITTCGVQATTDGGGGTHVDAGMGPTVMIMVHVDGNGGVRTSNNDYCDSLQGPMDCMYTVASGSMMTFTAFPHLTKQFDKWDGPTCMNQASPCHATIAGPGNANINAKFK